MNKKSVFIGLALGSTWFGTHCGSGFATGAQTNSFFVVFGAWGIVTPLISVAVMALVAFFTWKFCHTFKTYNYREFSDALFKPYDKIFGTIYELLFLALMTMGMGSVFAGGGQLVSQVLNLPYMAGVLVLSACVFILTIFGSKVLLNSAAILSIVLVGTITVVSVAGISTNFDVFSRVVGNWETQGSLIDALWAALFYGTFQCIVLGATIAVTDSLTSDADVKASTILGTIMNGAMMLILPMMLLCFYPGVTKEVLPVLAAIQQTGIPFLAEAYSLMLFLAFVTTGISLIFSIVKRFEKYGAGIVPKVQTRRAIYSVMFLVISFLISIAGLVAIVSKGYYAIGLLAFPCVVIPTLVVAPIKIKKKRQAEAGLA
ncbi:hypothetical protein LJC48_04095 [Desulfovibrio sp. OttesenSCG-928-C06]|nr:hypothetical protein [Desulfovibrio sp. OttesenSCG-928-C06]